MTNWPVDDRGIILIYATGYDDAGTFVPVKRKHLPVPPADFAAFAASTPDVSGGFFPALKTWCYAQIQADATA